MLKIEKFTPNPTGNSVGRILIRYHALIMRCELMVWKKESLWIKMPEVWVTPEKKKQFCFWPAKPISDGFQFQVLQLLKDEHGVDLKQALCILQNAKKKKSEKKKLDDKQN